jgi:hypothetical protein
MGSTRSEVRLESCQEHSQERIAPAADDGTSATGRIGGAVGHVVVVNAHVLPSSAPAAEPGPAIDRYWSPTVDCPQAGMPGSPSLEFYRFHSQRHKVFSYREALCSGDSLRWVYLQVTFFNTPAFEQPPP